MSNENQRSYQNFSGLKRLAKVAAGTLGLMRIASSLSPSSCIESAKRKGFTDSEAQSAYWLAVLRRDYGQEVFIDFVSEELEAKESHKDQPQIKAEVEFLVGCIVILKRQIEMVDGTLGVMASSEMGVVKKAFSEPAQGGYLFDMIRELESAIQKLRGIEAYMEG